jgi:hypothetical protein
LWCLVAVESAIWLGSLGTADAEGSMLGWRATDLLLAQPDAMQSTKQNPAAMHLENHDAVDEF